MDACKSNAKIWLAMSFQALAIRVVAVLNCVCCQVANWQNQSSTKKNHVKMHLVDNSSRWHQWPSPSTQSLDPVSGSPRQAMYSYYALSHPNAPTCNGTSSAVWWHDAWCTQHSPICRSMLCLASCRTRNARGTRHMLATMTKNVSNKNQCLVMSWECFLWCSLGKRVTKRILTDKHWHIEVGSVSSNVVFEPGSVDSSSARPQGCSHLSSKSVQNKVRTDQRRPPIAFWALHVRCGMNIGRGACMSTFRNTRVP